MEGEDRLTGREGGRRRALRGETSGSQGREAASWMELARTRREEEKPTREPPPAARRGRSGGAPRAQSG